MTPEYGEVFNLPKRDGPNYHNMMALEHRHQCPDMSFTIVANRRAKELGQELIYSVTCNQCEEVFLTLSNKNAQTRETDNKGL